MARVREVLRDLWNACTPHGLLQALEALQEVPSAQRLGALLTLDGQGALASQVAGWLRGKSLRTVPLEIGQVSEIPPVVDSAFKVQLPADLRVGNT
jgi:hypothetical protein